MEEILNKKKRPVLIWIISIFFVVSAGWALLSFYLVLSGAIPLELQQKEYFDSLSIFDYGYTIAIGLLNLTGAIALFMLRVIAFYVFSSALALNILATIWNIVSKGWLEAIGNSGLVGMLIGLGIAAGVCLYSFNLMKRGVLD